MFLGNIVPKRRYNNIADIFGGYQRIDQKKARC